MHRHAAVGRGQGQLAHQQRIQAPALQAQLGPQVHVDVRLNFAFGRHRAGICGLLAIGRRIAGPIQDIDVVANGRGVGLADVDEAFVHHETAVGLDVFRAQDQLALPADQQAAVHPLKQGKVINGQVQPRFGLGTQQGITVQADGAALLTAFGLELRQAGMVAIQAQLQDALGQVDAQQGMTGPQVLPIHLALVQRRAQGAGQHRIGLHLPRQAPPRWGPDAPWAQIGDLHVQRARQTVACGGQAVS